MSRSRLAIVIAGAADRDPFDVALDARIESVVRRVLGDEGGASLVDVVGYVADAETRGGLRRKLLRACRTGGIEGAVRPARRWLASRSAIDAYLRQQGPRPVASRDDGAEFEGLRARLARGVARRTG